MKGPYKSYDYGGLVVDFKEKKSFSRQGYCSLGIVNAQQEQGWALVEALQKAGDLKKVIPSTWEVHEGIKEFRDLEEVKEKLTGPGFNYVHVETDGPLEVDHNCQVDTEGGFHAVKKWAKAHGWKLKTTKE